MGKIRYTKIKEPTFTRTQCTLFQFGVANRLRLARLHNDLRLVDVADHFGCTVDMISRYENCRSLPPLFTLCCLAELYGVSLEWLCYGKGVGV